MGMSAWFVSSGSWGVVGKRASFRQQSAPKAPPLSLRRAGAGPATRAREKGERGRFQRLQRGAGRAGRCGVRGGRRGVTILRLTLLKTLFRSLKSNVLARKEDLEASTSERARSWSPAETGTTCLLTAWRRR